MQTEQTQIEMITMEYDKKNTRNIMNLYFLESLEEKKNYMKKKVYENMNGLQRLTVV